MIRALKRSKKKRNSNDEKNPRITVTQIKFTIAHARFDTI